MYSSLNINTPSTNLVYVREESKHGSLNQVDSEESDDHLVVTQEVVEKSMVPKNLVVELALNKMQESMALGKNKRYKFEKGATTITTPLGGVSQI